MPNKIKCYLLKLKNKKCQNIKGLPHSFLYFEGKMHLYLCVNLYFYATIVMKQYLITFYAHFFTKYAVILNFNFSHTIYPQLCIVPL